MALYRAGKAQPRGPRRRLLPPVTVQGRALAGWNGVLKRGEDILSASLFLSFISPFFALIMLLVRIDTPGPVFFRQQRYGFNNRPFTVLKFRTMFDRPDDPAVPQAQRNDPRVTRVGAFLRRTSLDELPQLINVLRGDMSFVGPRPHAAAHNEKFGASIDYYLARHRVKPGITGWAQISGWRGETPTVEHMRARVEHDLYYIDNWSLAFDFYILLKTIPVVLLGRNAW
jgi:exopolysaccharide biosynthesis polyprenyl glycosylphosphotransferase